MRTLVSPLLVMYVLLIPGLIYVYRRINIRSYRTYERQKKVVLFLLSFTVLVFLLSLPVVSSRLAYIIERPYLDFEGAVPPDTDYVVVLSGGYMVGPEPELDLPGHITSLRVMRGVKAYNTGDEQTRLIMQGWSPDLERGQMTGLMRELARDLAVPDEHIIEESYSTNTWQHPRRLIAETPVTADDSVAVVTSAWHLRRARQEYERFFGEVRPVPADFYTFTQREGIQNFLPRVNALQISTSVFQEYVGGLWYELKYRVNSYLN